MCENVISKKKVIVVFCGNKLCKKGEVLWRRGVNVICLDYLDFIVNVVVDINIGNEKRWVGECICEI